MSEIWKNVGSIVEGLEEYSISNHGNVRYDVTGRIRKQTVHKNGYIVMGLKGKNYRIHRLVATLFVPNPENKPFVNHKDGNKTNNHHTNLEWVTGAENTAHAVNKGLYVAAHGEKHYDAVLSEKDVIEIKKMLVRKVKSKDIAKEFGVSSSAISAIKRGITWTHVQVEGFYPSSHSKKLG